MLLMGCRWLNGRMRGLGSVKDHLNRPVSLYHKRQIYLRLKSEDESKFQHAKAWK